ncbi:MAG: 50S ribosomal protein L11 methyltransferase [Desulfobacterales bacterium]|jgi:protein arginine N-methyltransferase 1
MYSLFGYAAMIADSVRMNAYATAIESRVRPGMAVLDLGTGTGIFSLLACRAGARKVYAVDPSEAVQVGREIARANGLKDRIVFIQDRSSAIDLPEPVDLIVSDMRGVLPFFSSHLSDIADARDRFLSSTGHMIPLYDHIFGMLAETPQIYGEFVSPWSESPFGFDMAAASRYQVNQWKKVESNALNAVSSPCRWLSIDYSTLAGPSGSGQLAWSVEKKAAAQGFVLWFDTRLTEECGFSNAPDQPETIYGKAFFPFQEPLPLESRDQVLVDLKAEYVDREYIWRWNTVHRSKDDEQKAAFSQSTFWARPLSLESLEVRDSTHRPTLTPQGEVDRRILNLMNGEKTLGDIAENVARHFPDRYPSLKAALKQVSRLSSRYSKKTDGH